MVSMCAFAGGSLGIDLGDLVSFAAFAHFGHCDGFPFTVTLDPDGGAWCGVFEFGFHAGGSRGIRRSQRFTLFPRGPAVQRGA